MRFYVSILAALGLTASACGKKEEKKPEPTTQEVKKEEPAKKDPNAEAPKKEEPVAEPTKKEEPVAEPTKKEEPPVAERKGPEDRVAAMQQAFVDYTAGKLDETFANFTDDATWTEVGVPNGELKGLAAIKDFHKAQQAGFSELSMKIGRIIDAGEHQVVEYVWSGKNTGKLLTGQEPTGKIAVVPGALLVHYTPAGLVDKAWAFQDHMNAMQQLGVAPGLAADFTPVAMPETTEVVKGEFNAALADTYKAFGAKMGPDTINAAIDEMVADDFTMASFRTGKTITGKDGLKESMKGWMSMFQMTEAKPEMVFGAGDYLVVVTTNTMAYKGGIEGVEAKDQPVTCHELVITRLEGGKFKSYASYMNNMEVAMALGMMGGAASKPDAEEPKAEDAKPAAEVPSFGVASCDAYVKGIMACVEKVPEAARGAINDSLKQTLETWKTVAAQGDAQKAALEQGCKSMLDATKQSMSSMCPDVKWE
ncbi:MAG: nuclear transport factor 2 family protein [Deltaproteobacteria bacterium]|nr:nuclear transport factor 2 family protein [Deltaproteobacteria bacterium]